MKSQNNTNADTAGKVMVIDDEPAMRDVISFFLKPLGYEIITFDSGEAAIEVLANTPLEEMPDVIILDVVMPGMNGFEVCRFLKENPATHFIPVIMLTGSREQQVHLDAVKAGADEFLHKPFDAVLLKARIQSSIESKRLHDQVIGYQRELELHNEKLEMEVRERTREILRTQRVAILSLAKLAETRDTETGKHVERLRAYGDIILKELREHPHYRSQIDKFFEEQFSYSVPLHDIGKVGIPDRILLKPGKLTNSEFEVMKFHTLIGAETLAIADREAGGNSFFAMGRDIALYHHERWDGKGYPHGIQGEDIPLSARITSLCDVFDALSSPRPYKDPFPHEKVCDIILSGKGTQFDPVIAEIFEKHHDVFAEIYSRLIEDEEASRLEEIIKQLEKIEKENTSASEE